MTPGKRLFDIVLALCLLIPLALVMVLVAIVLLVGQGRPVLYGSERMHSPVRSFHLWKFRTMRPSVADGGVSGGDKNARVTPIGRFLRRTRLDELPQLFNILKGDMSFVGPRPPLRQYVEAFPALYAQVLQARPGVTGLASVLFHRHEERILSTCSSAEETDRTYRRRCIPRKARIDLIYLHRRTLCLDLMIIGHTVSEVAKRRDNLDESRRSWRNSSFS